MGWSLGGKRTGDMKGDDLSEGFLAFVTQIIRVANALPKTTAGRHVCGQVLRSGTSAGSNYEEARGAESKADFTHKLGIALKELRESAYWLNLIDRARLSPSEKIAEVVQEADELSRIVAKSIQTARQSVRRQGG